MVKMVTGWIIMFFDVCLCRSKLEPEKHWLQDKGRIYGHYIDMWGHVDAMLNDGFAWDPDLSDSDYTSM